MLHTHTKVLYGHTPVSFIFLSIRQEVEEVLQRRLNFLILIVINLDEFVLITDQDVCINAVTPLKLLNECRVAFINSLKQAGWCQFKI